MNDLPPRWEALRRALDVVCQGFAVTGIRDPDNRCADFELLPDGERPSGRGRCRGDGHYLCRECQHLAHASPYWPRVPCPACVNKPSGFRCDHCGDTGEVDQPGWERA